MPDGDLTPEPDTRAKESAARAKRRARERAHIAEGRLKFPSDVWLQHAAMEGIYNFGELVGIEVDDPDDKKELADKTTMIVDRLGLALAGEPYITRLLAEKSNAICPADISAPNPKVHWRKEVARKRA